MSSHTIHKDIHFTVYCITAASCNKEIFSGTVLRRSCLIYYNFSIFKGRKLADLEIKDTTVHARKGETASCQTHSIDDILQLCSTLYETLSSVSETYIMFTAESTDNKLSY